MRLTLPLLILLLTARPLAAQTGLPNPADLDRIAQETAQAEARKTELLTQRNNTAKDIERLRADLIKAAAEAESYEQAARDIAARLRELNTEQALLNRDIYADRQALSDLLAALQRIERNPPPALAVNPQDAKEAVQAARLLTSLSTSLKTRADELSQRLENLSFVHKAITKEQAAMAQSEADIAVRRAAIKTVVGEKTALERKISQQTAEEETRIARLASQADDLRDLIAKFEAIARSAQPRIKPDIPAPSSASVSIGPSGIPAPRIKPRADRPPQPLTLPLDTQRFADARGSLRAPTRGSLVTGYNARQNDGTRSKGLTVKTRGEAQVISPYSGRIEFVAPFKNYKRVLILNVGDGYFILMTGLGQTFVQQGERVTAGEPVGLMPVAQSGDPDLYIEIRKDGTPINPSPWLGTAFAKHG